MNSEALNEYAKVAERTGILIRQVYFLPLKLQEDSFGNCKYRNHEAALADFLKCPLFLCIKWLIEKIYKYSNLPTKDLQKKMKCNIEEQQMAPKYYFFNCIGFHK